MHLSDIDRSYMAGAIDGEGCIGVYLSEGSYRLTFAIRTTSIDWLYGLREKWGGLGCISMVPIKNPKHKPQAQWMVYNDAAKKILEEVVPFLQIKKSQALLALEFNTVEHVRCAKTGRYVKTTDKDREYQRIIADRLKDLKSSMTVN